MKIFQIFDLIPGFLRFTIAVLLVFIIGFCDYITGEEISFSIFYFIPIFFTVWFFNRPGAVIISILSVISWFFADFLVNSHYSHYLISFWNSFVRLGIFLLFVFILARLKTALENERKMARRDFLTGLSNVKFFLELSAHELNRCKRYRYPYSLLYFDCDNFKGINDKFGHDVGNSLLQIIAFTLNKNIRTMDIAGRLGGDEFAVFFPQTTRINALKIAQKIRKLLLHRMKQNSWDVTFSMGLVIYNTYTNSIEEVIKKADGLMYQAKKNGKNKIKYKFF